MASRSDITPELCRELLEYDAATGALFWRARPASMFTASKPGAYVGPGAYIRTAEQSCATWNAKNAGKRALNTPDGKAYFHGRIYGAAFLAHRVAWAIHYGKWPEHNIDHINGEPTDNRIENLRDVAQIDNQKNQKLHSQNTSGVCGVWFSRRKNRWCAEVIVGGKKVGLGLFKDIADAAEARAQAEIEYGFHENHGRPTSTPRSPLMP